MNGDDGGIRRGRDAQLSKALRQVLDEDMHVENDNEQESILLQPVAVHATLVTEVGFPQSSDGVTNGSFHRVTSNLIVTSERVLLVAIHDRNTQNDGRSALVPGTDDAAQSDLCINDLSIDAVCVDLHAISQDPWSVYLQLTNGTGNDLDGGNNAEIPPPLELTLFPVVQAASAENNKPNSLDEVEGEEDICRMIFDSLTDLISRHPIVTDDDYNEENVPNGDEDKDEMICASSILPMMKPQQNVDDDDKDKQDEEATEEERTAMLERLDRVLTVPPEYEIPDGNYKDNNEGCVVEGQFDDAD